MAARQDQTQQIALISCGVLIVLLGIGLYFAYDGYRDTAAALASAKNDVQSNRSAATEAVNEAVRLKEMMGFDPQTNLKDLDDQFTADQERLMGTFAESNRNYRAVIDTLAEENRKIALQESEAKNRAKALKDALTALEAEKEAEVEQFKAEAQKAREDLAGERQQYAAERDRIQTETKKLTAQVKQLESDKDTAIAQARSEVSSAQAAQAEAERSRDKFRAERTVENPSFEVADGQITFVNQATGAAWINLGEADALRRQVTFSVFDSDLTDAGKAKKKGSVEVVRILGDHLAEARITRDNPSDPVLPGDQVYSQVWQRGQKRHFALTGLIDFNGDGQSDIEDAKNLIALNGGVLDAYAADDGEVNGEITISTRYLVLGRYPETASKSGLRQAYDTMSREADQKGVETIRLLDFMAQMGYQPTESTFRYGSGAAGSGAQAGGSGGYYRFRLP